MGSASWPLVPSRTQAASFGKYRVVGELGRGATGIVYRAVDDTLGREVALKALNPAVAEPEVLRRFRAEASVLARLNHPGIATIYELFRAEGELFMVMELVHGETLEHLSRRLGPLPPDRAAYLVDRILFALDHAHRAGIVHRDVKPANLMVTSIGGVKIMDFGVARARGAQHLTLDGYLVGTPAYMAPEQVLGHGVDHRADLYSVGVVLYRLLTGELPFTADTPVGMLQQQISESPTPLRARRAGLPEWCEAVVERALAKSPQHRFHDAGAFRDALRRANGSSAFTELALDIQTPDLPAIEPRDEGPGTESQATVPIATIPLSVLPPEADALRAALRQKDRAQAVSALVVFGAVVAMLACIPWLEARGSGIVDAAVTATITPERVFKAAALDDSTERLERDARLVFSDRALTITVRGAAPQAIRGIRYERVMSISYSRGHNPMWASPAGPALVARAPYDALRLMGAPINRHWITVRTTTEPRFVILGFDAAHIKGVLTALEARTGRAPQVVGTPAG